MKKVNDLPKNSKKKGLFKLIRTKEKQMTIRGISGIELKGYSRPPEPGLSCLVPWTPVIKALKRIMVCKSRSRK